MPLHSKSLPRLHLQVATQTRKGRLFTKWPIGATNASRMEKEMGLPAYRPRAVTTISARFARSERRNTYSIVACALPCTAIVSSTRRAKPLIPGHLSSHQGTNQGVGEV